jgi:mannosyl-oligosaccharide alpha-1,2-mannosidase
MYILRPETIESIFYMYRLTKDEKYRDWAWEIMQNIEETCRTDTGYAGIKNVNVDKKSIEHIDLQESFFLAETLKYLYLIFADDDYISLDKYVFNTEAHVLGVLKKSKLKRKKRPARPTPSEDQR